MSIFRLVFAFLILCVTPITFALPSIEKNITEYINSEKIPQLALLEKLVNINSGTMNIEGVKAVGEILRPEFEALGFKTRWVNEPESMQRAPTLIAEHPGTQGKRILLIGHLDTVFAKTSPFQKYERKGDIAKGPGVVDDKGGDVVILYALKALQAAHALDKANITVVLTGDEEDSGKPTSLSRKPLFDAASKNDIALDFEGSITLDTATIARRGISSWVITTTGNEAHSSNIFQPTAGFGAIFELTRILNTMREDLSNEKYLTFSPGLMVGGTTITLDKNNSEATILGEKNVIAKTALAKGDLRFLTKEQKLAAQKKIEAIVNKHLPGTNATVTFQDAIPGMAPTAGNLDLLKKYSAVSQDLGYGEVKAYDPALRGAGDISHIASLVSASLSGLGALGTGLHSEKETLTIQYLPIQTERAAVLIYRLIQD